MARDRKIITYSRNVFIPVTRLCRNRCAYCGFVQDPSQGNEPILSPEKVLDLLDKAVASGCNEALFVLGERPEASLPVLSDLLRSLGFRNQVDYLHYLCTMALRRGLLPHTNAGLLTREELGVLRSVNVSLGLMLESVNTVLCKEGGPHALSPGKQPQLRLDHIAEAGRQGIPFTTGILVGIGESAQDRRRSLLEIHGLHQIYGHIQEIIIQPFYPKRGTPMEDHPPPPISDLLETIAAARQIFGDEMNIQVPPNLIEERYDLFLEAGINDWGGISPLTVDMINPEKPWPTIETLRSETERSGYLLKERLPVYPGFMDKLPDRIRRRVMDMVDPFGYRRAS